MLLSVLLSQAHALTGLSGSAYNPKSGSGQTCPTGQTCPNVTVPEPVQIFPDPNFPASSDAGGAAVELGYLPSSYRSMAADRNYVTTGTNTARQTVPASTHFTGTLNGMAVDFYFARSTDKNSALLYGTITRKTGASADHIAAYLSGNGSGQWTITGTFYDLFFGSTLSVASLTGTLTYTCWGSSAAPSCGWEMKNAKVTNLFTGTTSTVSDAPLSTTVSSSDLYWSSSLVQSGGVTTTDEQKLYYSGSTTVYLHDTGSNNGVSTSGTYYGYSTLTSPYYSYSAVAYSSSASLSALEYDYSALYTDAWWTIASGHTTTVYYSRTAAVPANAASSSTTPTAVDPPAYSSPPTFSGNVATLFGSF